MCVHFALAFVGSGERVCKGWERTISGTMAIPNFFVIFPKNKNPADHSFIVNNDTTSPLLLLTIGRVNEDYR